MHGFNRIQSFRSAAFMDNDKPTSPRTIVRSVQNDLPEAAPSSVMSDTSVVSLPRESDLVREHKSYVSCLMLFLR